MPTGEAMRLSESAKPDEDVKRKRKCPSVMCGKAHKDTGCQEGKKHEQWCSQKWELDVKTLTS